MTSSRLIGAGLAPALLALAACAGGPALPRGAGYGPDPQLPEPHRQLIPLVKVAPADGWAPGRTPTPTPAPGLAVAAFATGLQHPRWLLVLPNGDVLVAETDGPAKKRSEGIRGFFMGLIMKTAGSGTPSPNRIVLLRDADGDGVAETRSALLQGLNSPFGMALVGADLYVADTDAILRFPYADGAMRIDAPASKLLDLPAGPINHHWTKSLIASPDGSRLYVTIGSNSNVGENGLQNEAGRAAIWEVDRITGRAREFATGLRNPNGMGWEPHTGRLWVAVNERDEIGSDLVPDYMTSVRESGFYGWPFSYYGQYVDRRVKAQRPDLVASAIKPDYALGSHTASLGLAFYQGGALPEAYRGGAFVGQHGSWNRSRFNGYQVIFVPFADGRPSGGPQPVLTGFLDRRGHAQGRPVGVAVDRAGALLVADDVGGAVWRVTGAGSAAPLNPRR